MEELLQQMIGKRVDVSCAGTRVVRGDVVEIKAGILYLRDEDDNTSYVAVDKVAIVCEVKESVSRPGFVS